MKHAILPMVVLCLAWPAPAQTSTVFSYQGHLTNAGQPAGGPHDMAFTLWDALSGGNQIGSANVRNDVHVANGVFTVELDYGAPAFDNSDRWLQITVEGFVLSPRQPITRSPYAIQTRGIFVSDAGRVGIGTTDPQAQLDMEAPESILRLSSTDGSPATLSRLQFQTVNAPGIFTPLGAIEFFDQAGARLALIQGTKASTTAQVAINVTPGQVSQLTVKPGVIDAAADLRFLRPTDLATSASIGTAGADSFFQAHGGGLGIGTTAPAARLHAIGESGAATAVLGETGSTIGRGVAGHATAATGSNFGVVGQSDSASGTGVLGYTLATTGENSSVWGWNNSTAGRGVYGLAANAFGESYGVYGRSAGSAGVGVFGEAAAGTGFTAGVHGKSASFSGAGVRAEGAGPLGTALDIRSGSIRVAGAGPGTSTPAFIHVATQANSNNCDGSGCFCYATRIDHPLCNGDPSAILLVTVNGRAGSGSTLLQRVEYDVGEARWYIHVFFDEYFCAGQKFNVLVIKS